MGSWRYSNILFIGCTNFRERLDEAFLRSSRMSVHVLLHVQPEQQRKHKWNTLQKMCLGSKDFASNEKLFLRRSLNFSLAQMNEFGSALRSVSGSGETVDMQWSMLLHQAARTSELTAGHLADMVKYGEGVNSDSMAETDKVLISPLKHMLSTGRLVCSVPGRYVRIDDGVWSFPSTVSSNDDVRVSQLIASLVYGVDAEYVFWLDAKWREDNERSIDRAVDELLDTCHKLAATGEGDKNRCFIVVEMDEILGVVPVSYTWSTGQSSAVQSGVSDTFTLGESASEAKSAGHSNSTSWSLGQTASRTFGESTSLALGTGGSESTSTTTGATIGIPPSFGASSTSTSSSSWNKTDTATRSASISLAISATKAVTAGLSISETSTTSKQRSQAKGVTQTAGSTSQTGLQVTLQVQYPKCVASISRLFHRINRSRSHAKQPKDPFIVLVYRLYDPNPRSQPSPISVAPNVTTAERRRFG